MVETQGLSLSNGWANALLCLSIIFAITTTASIILRLVAKRKNRQQLTGEDYTIFLAQFFLYVFIVLSIMAIFFGGVGHHTYDLPESMVPTFVKILLAIRVTHTVTVSLVKISICLFYTRIFFTNAFAVASRTAIGIILTWMTATIMTFFLICAPLPFYWDHTIVGGKCGNQRAAFTTIGTVDLITDIIVFILPIPMIWRLQISKDNKVALSGVFGLGLSTVIICVLRVMTLVRVDQDVTYSAAPPLLWSFLEPAVGITVACGPLIGPLLRGGRWVKGETTKGSRTGGSSARFERIDEPQHRLQSIHVQNGKSAATLSPMGNVTGVTGGAGDTRSVSSSRRSKQENPGGLKSGFD
ncbi:hypothetical protein HYFRA_00007283 [Hymenoscyphus fraxineus]|uniref:Rhodopsin domain-containing protein n=1 Tax=Hymenoscyphus fraxineus TaxID=746836 RepID=A0A9N9KQ74_9HELO|nr:hypothetical protein HYFRA_00007283 [Hymenoscyphus fraxineus]